MCLSAKPVVDGIERAVRGRATVLRADILTPPGRTLWDRYSVRFVPTLVLFDGAGREVWRHEGFPDRDEAVRRIAALAGT